MASKDTLWSDCLRYAKFWRNEVKRSFGETINNLKIIEDEASFLNIF